MIESIDIERGDLYVDKDGDICSDLHMNVFYRMLVQIEHIEVNIAFNNETELNNK